MSQQQWQQQQASPRGMATIRAASALSCSGDPGFSTNKVQPLLLLLLHVVWCMYSASAVLIAYSMDMVRLLLQVPLVNGPSSQASIRIITSSDVHVMGRMAPS